MTRQLMFPTFFVLFYVASAYLTTHSRGQSPLKIAKSVQNVKDCRVCGIYRCPSDSSECLLGLMPDVCGCCSAGVCARLNGESCWNASIVELPKVRKNEGFCARNYVCTLRTDLEHEDLPEATCTCMEKSMACGTNNRTYETLCALHEEAMRLEGSVLRLQHLGPCSTRPTIYSRPRNIVGTQGQFIALNCEAKGFPVPDIYWEFHSADGSKVLRLPNDELNNSDVNTGIYPESSMRGSWLQLEHLEKHQTGVYYCIATNSFGDATAASYVSIR